MENCKQIDAGRNRRRSGIRFGLGYGRSGKKN